MLACARIGAIHSVVFGGFAANELASRIEDAQAEGRRVRRRAGSSRARIVAYKPLLDAAIEHGRVEARALHHPPAAAARGRARPGARPRLGRGGRAAPSRRTASPSRRPIRSTSSTRRARPASRRASCATTAATRSRSQWTMKHIYDVEPGEVYWAASDIGWVVGHSYIVYGAAAARLHDRPLRGQAGRHARRRRVLARDRASTASATLFTAPTAFRAIRQQDPDGELIGRYDLSRLPRALPRRRALRPGDARAGPRRSSACR